MTGTYRSILIPVMALIVCATLTAREKAEALPFDIHAAYTPSRADVPAHRLVCRYEQGVFLALYNQPRQLPDSDSCFFELEHLQTGRMDSLYYHCNDLFRPHIIEYFARGDSLILVDLMHLIVMVKDRPGRWKPASILPLPASALHCRLDRAGERLHVWTDVCSSHKLEKSCFYSYTLHLDDGGIISAQILDPPGGAALMYSQPRNILDRQDGIMAFAQVSDYAIHFLDTSEFNPVDSLIAHPESWVSTQTDISIPPGVKVQSYFPLIDSLRKASSSIRRIALLSRDSLLVMWDTPGDSGQGLRSFLDLWYRTDSGWRTIIRNRNNSYPGNSTGGYTLAKKPLSGGFAYDSGYFIEVIPAPPGAKVHARWESYETFRTESDNWYIEHPLQYMVLVRKIDNG